MQSLRYLALASLFTLMAAPPAAAAWQGIGQARFGTALDHAGLAGPDRPVRALEFTARNNPMYCDNIRAHFMSGRTVEVYSGGLAQGRTIRVDLPGGSHRIRRLTMRCRATHNWAFVEVAANTGRGGRSQILGPVPGSGPRPGPGWGRDGGFDRLPHSARWQRVGVESFEGRRDRETAAAGWAGRLVEAVALRPLNGDARCNRVVAEFRHGIRRQLDADRFRRMRRGRYYTFDLPGDVRNLVRLHLSCRAVGDDEVRIEIFTRRGR